MEVVLSAVLVVCGAIVLFNSTLKLCFVGRLAHRALVIRSLRGYWGDFFEHCTEGRYSTLVALAVALVVYLILMPMILAASLLRWIWTKSHVRGERGQLVNRRFS